MSSVALVVLDTLRKDSFDEFFEWLPGTRYENAYSTSGWTVPAHGSLFTGLYPSQSGVYAKFESLSPDERVLAERLSNGGYTTRGFSANANISDPFAFTRGFDEFHHSWRGERRDEGVFDWGEFISRTSDMGAKRYLMALAESIRADRPVKSLEIGLKMKARDLGIESIAGRDDGATKAKELVESTDFGENEFLFLNLMEAHGPYNAPKSYRTVDLENNPSFEDTVFDGPDEDQETIRAAYDDCVRYLSDVYEDIFATLSREFEYVITVSDHGEQFGNDGLWDHNFGIYPELTHVPLTVFEGSDGREHRQETVSIKDLYPTVLDLANCLDGDGLNILAEFESDGRYVERFGLRTSRLEKLQNKGYDDEFIADWDRHFFGFATASGVYTWESHKGIQYSGSLDRNEAEDILQQYRESLDPVEGHSLSDIPDDVEQQLVELGYM